MNNNIFNDGQNPPSDINTRNAIHQLFLQQHMKNNNINTNNTNNITGNASINNNNNNNGINDFNNNNNKAKLDPSGASPNGKRSLYQPVNLADFNALQMLTNREEATNRFLNQSMNNPAVNGPPSKRMGLVDGRIGGPGGIINPNIRLSSRAALAQQIMMKQNMQRNFLSQLSPGDQIAMRHNLLHSKAMNNVASMLPNNANQRSPMAQQHRNMFSMDSFRGSMMPQKVPGHQNQQMVDLNVLGGINSDGMCVCSYLFV